MSEFFAEPEAAALPPDDGQPCGSDCRFARTIRTDPFAEEWLWCTHPARATRLVHPGRPCERYAPGERGSVALPPSWA
ncbi:MAG: hypothetical protein HZA32_09980 [Opitutae bacterium]|nr:hypothetical protein [Opitutae bacterium]